MIFELNQSFYFEAAHSLVRQESVTSPAATRDSRRIHGHTYHAEIGVQGERDAESGMVVDLSALRHEIDTLHTMLDHRLLDEVPGLGAATLENLCGFIWRQLEPVFPGLSTVLVERRASGDRCTLRRKP